MSNSSLFEKLRACSRCGLIHQFENRALCNDDESLVSDHRICCSRCGALFLTKADRAAKSRRVIAASLGSLALYFPAVTLPLLTIEQLGQRHQTSLLQGTADLFTHHNYLVGLVVLVFSVLLPAAKILVLLELTLFKQMPTSAKPFLYHSIELLGKWSMLDVLLLAMLVMVIKLGGIIEFQVGPAVIAFIGCVIMNAIATISFDPESIWAE